MEITVKNRDWVKNAAIIFLAVLLVLTFFSNTIMNRTLAEVATAPVNSGSIVAKVRGTGKVTANGSTEIKMKQTRSIKAVKVKAGQEVKAGDVLFVLGEGDSKELEEAQEKLRQLELSYKRSSLSYPTANFVSQDIAVQRAYEAYVAAVNAQNDAMERYYSTVIPVQEVEDEKARLQKMIDELDVDIAALEEECRVLIEKDDALLSQIEVLNAAIAEEEAKGDAKDQSLIDSYNAQIANIENQRKNVTGTSEDLLTVINAKNDKIDELRRERAKLQYNYETISKESYQYSGDPVYKAQYEAAIKAADDAEDAYFRAVASADESYSSYNKSAAVSSLDLQDIQYQIDKQKEIVDKLSGTSEDNITATVGGTVTTISATAGQTVQADAVLCTIEVEDMGYTVSFSVTNDQAQRLRIGDTATISNYYWGRQTVATLTSIRNDPKSPQSNKLLTFDLDGDVNSGSDITISVGSKSANYDHVIPSSAIRSDSNGSFVLAIEARNSPLGNRYTAKRVSVEVIASDDENSAVNGALENGDFVITTSNSPIKSGDMVRMADNA